MQFYSLVFIVFLAVALAAYYLVGRLLGKGQWVVLLVASLGFYAYAGWQNLVFIVGTALVTWLAGIGFGKLAAKQKEASEGLDRDGRKAVKKQFRSKKRLVLAAALLAAFGVLSYIKYAAVIVSYFAPGSGWTAGILLPLGISFYTFQSAGYVIDTYNEKYGPERNFARYLLFVSFFPQLIQGPINRFDALAHQLYERHAFDAGNARSALLRIGYGLLKKCAIADVLVGTVNATFDHVYPGLPGSVIVFSILVYAVYQYADFSGGIDIVLGVAQLFGVSMAENFRQPYFSVSLGDFWRRWHITLGTWMRDYVFYPFALLPGVKRWGKRLTARFGRHIGRTLPASVANIIVFFLVGLWHGAESHYILWGLYNGLVIAGSDMLTPLWDRMNKALHVDLDGKAHHVFCIVRTFIVVNIGWYFDRIVDFGDTLLCFHNTLFNFAPDEFAAAAQQLSLLPPDNCRIAVVALVIVFVVSVLRERDVDVRASVLALPVPARIALYALVCFLIAVSFSFASSGGFMYANF